MIQERVGSDGTGLYMCLVFKTFYLEVIVGTPTVLRNNIEISLTLHPLCPSGNISHNYEGAPKTLELASGGRLLVVQASLTQ